ncbi:Superfamily II DNA/RNA helicase [Ignavibacterium album JCM 16511]|uniref:RNA helicase n=1 Tax=Ignavibacterium album (strain DSM 19864 / JCM 16511 / NBRC 101810 / Mat9-16) TaxID=945713 RepID=I0AIP2_IGNAJ|nr:DEAD/DEAH box helicase [Ignavibacterium album]AFH48849.1 Superfamily II DNA/RNA helicase [Ignavibacterium album JCM 16511]
MKTFEELGLEHSIVTAIKELGFENPMTVQEKVIPVLLEDKENDVIALAQTGTGKTAAYGLPIIQKVNTKKSYTQYLILSPTRELCLQIADDLSDFAKYKSDVKIAAVFGGSSIERQIQLVRSGAHIISATPGRLIDLLKRKVVDLSKVNTIILDEADEMLNMGFRDDLEEILKSTTDNKNTLLFSATMSSEIRSIANKFMFEPVEITIGKKNVGAENIKHICYTVNAKDRYLTLKRIVDYYPEIYGIIFCRTKRETQDVADLLLKDGYNAEALHGDLSQAQRETVMNKFRQRNIQLLIATDVAARGLDVDGLTHVINYNLPDELEIYTHRSGRTGRAGKTGTSIVITNLKEKSKLRTIENQTNKKFEHHKVPSGNEICARQLFHLVDRVEKVEVDDSKIQSFLPEIMKKLDWCDREELIKKFVSVEFNRFLSYYSNLRDIETPIESIKYKSGNSSNFNFKRFFINLGQLDELKPKTLIDMINDFTGINNIEIGEIEILKTFSFFEVDSEYADKILFAFKDKYSGKRKISVEVSEGRTKNRSKKFFRAKGGNSRKDYRRKSFQKSYSK